MREERGMLLELACLSLASPEMFVRVCVELSGYFLVGVGSCMPYKLFLTWPVLAVL
jgi:hypothetical protein